MANSATVYATRRMIYKTENSHFPIWNWNEKPAEERMREN
jgi:hypothetical protein